MSGEGMKRKPEAETEVQRATIYLRGGASFSFEVLNIKLTRNALTNELTDIKWEGKAEPYPLWLDRAEVAAVVVERVRA